MVRSAPAGPTAAEIIVIATRRDPALAAIVGACRALAPTALWVPGARPTLASLAPAAAPTSARHSVGLLALAGAARLWARGDVERVIRADFAQRAALDLWAAREVRRLRPRLVVAPSLGARRTLAAARDVGARAVLLLDLPLLRALHRDLDRAAGRWPERRLLRRVRASGAAIARQEAERVLAELIVVRGPYARATCVADGLAPAALVVAPRGDGAPLPRAGAPTGRVRLAGLAAPRHGVDVARAVVRARGLVLVCRIGDGTEPADLASLPGIATDDGPVDAVLAPTLCEAYPPELLAARRGGLAAVASPMAALAGDAGIDPYDDHALGAALDAALAAPGPALAPDAAAVTALGARLAALLGQPSAPGPGSLADVAPTCST